jgi:hypothetical protein
MSENVHFKQEDKFKALGSKPAHIKASDGGTASVVYSNSPSDNRQFET